MTLKRKIVLSGIGIVLAVGGYWWYTGRTPEAVPTEVVQRGTVSETVTVTGELVPDRYADMTFTSSGQIERVWVKEGENVKKGDPLASLQSSSLRSDLRSLELLQAIAESNEQLARRTWNKISPEERRAKVLASEKARADVASARATLAQRVLRAPFDGVVTRVEGREGETVTLGAAILRVAAAGPLVIEARIPESDVAKLRIGMVATVTFDAFTKDDVYHAALVSIDPSATIVQDVVSYVAKFTLTDLRDAPLRDGMTANIDIETTRRDGVLWVPYRALAKEGSKSYVEVKQADGSFQKVEVTTGLEGDEGTVEIKSGLKEGDEVTIGATQKK